jgi:hypothetical protein
MTVVDSVVSTSLFGRLMVAFSRRIMEGDLRARCENLKTLVEAAAPEKLTVPSSQMVEPYRTPTVAPTDVIRLHADPSTRTARSTGGNGQISARI